MFKSSILKHAVVCTLMVALSSCSFLRPSSQTVQVTCSNPNAMIYANGSPIGKGQALAVVPCNQRTNFTAESGGRRVFSTLETKISPAGWLDIAGTFLFIVPVLGILAPGFRQPVSDTVFINM